MNSPTPSLPNQQPTQPTQPAQSTDMDSVSVSNQLTPSEIDALRQRKQSIIDYVQRELPARLAALQYQLPAQKED